MKAYELQLSTLLNQVQEEKKSLAIEHKTLQATLSQNEQKSKLLESQNNILLNANEDLNEKINQISISRSQLDVELEETVLLVDILKAELTELKKALLEERNEKIIIQALLVDAKSSLDQVKQEYDSYTRSMLGKESYLQCQMNELLQKNTEMMTSLSNLSDQHVSTVNENQRLQKELAIMIECFKKKFIAYTLSSEKNIQSVFDFQENGVLSLNLKLQNFNERLTYLTRNVRQKNDKILKLQAAVQNAEGIQADNDTLKIRVEELETKVISYQTNCQQHVVQIQLHKDSLHSMEIKLIELERELRLVNDARSKLSQALSDLERVQKTNEAYLSLDEENNDLKSKIRALSEHLSEVKRLANSKDTELEELNRLFREEKENMSYLQNQIMELKLENNKLCGHTNSKQKIHLHMQLKKDIEDQQSALRQLEDRVTQLTMERNIAFEENKKLRSQLKTQKILSDQSQNIQKSMSNSRSLL